MLLYRVLENPSVYIITNCDWSAYEDTVHKDKTCVTPEDKDYCYKICFYSKDSVDKHLRALENVSSSEKKNQLRINKMGTFKKYSVVFYNPIKGEIISSKKGLKSNFLFS